MRLIDELLYDGTIMSPERAMVNWLIECLKESEGQRFILDNVADYYHQHEGRQYITIEDIPNVAPPFPLVWYEFRLSREYSKMFHADNVSDCGMLVITDDITDLDMQQVYDTLGLRRHTEVGDYVEIHKDNIRWISSAIIFGRMKLDGYKNWIACGPLGMIAYFIAPDGTPHKDFVMGDLNELYKNADEKVMSDMGIYLRDYFVFPCLLGIAFLHCKNVVITDTSIPAAIRKATMKRKGIELATHKVLDIMPMRRIIEHEAAGYEHSLPRSLHIVRGHFKNYKEGSGLFGKYHGLYFWQHYARGAGKQGKIVKTYRVYGDKAKVRV